MSKLLHIIERDISVGIYENCIDVAQIYEDRTVATLAGVRWVKNTGGYHEYKHRISGTHHEAIKAAAADDCAETVWEIIHAATEGG
jgi:hypothetical protein